jgi:phosphatidylserine decarboxylase
MSLPEPRSVADCPVQVFQPPSGGDITIESADGTRFRVHKVLLGLASSVLQGMLENATSEEQLKLWDTTEALSLMLCCLYPNEAPTVRSLREFRTGFETAQKYDMPSVARLLDQQLRSTLQHDPTKPVVFGLLPVWELASHFDLRETKEAAARLLTIKKCDMRMPATLVEFAARRPGSIGMVGLVGVQAARTTILTQLLFEFQVHPMRWKFSLKPRYYIMCWGCREHMEDLGLTHAPPSWLVSWASYAFGMLLSASPREANELFNIAVLDMLASRYPGSCCQDCVDDITSDNMLRSKFREWSMAMTETIENKLEELEVLYAL